MSHPWQFYAKISGACLLLGAGMEGFMIKTGFYDKVTEIEAERLEDTREEREAFQKMLRAEVDRQAKEKNVKINMPPQHS